MDKQKKTFEIEVMDTGQVMMRAVEDNEAKIIKSKFQAGNFIFEKMGLKEE